MVSQANISELVRQYLRGEITTGITGVGENYFHVMLYEEKINADGPLALAVVAYFAEKEDTGESTLDTIAFAITQKNEQGGESDVACLSFDVFEKTLDLDHRLVTSKELGLTGSEFLRIAEAEIAKLQENQLLPSWPFHISAGQISVIDWALKNGYVFKDKEKEDLYQEIKTKGTYKGQVVSSEFTSLESDRHILAWQSSAGEPLHSPKNLKDSLRHHHDVGNFEYPRFQLVKQPGNQNE